MTTADGKPATMLIDKRLAGLTDVQGYAAIAKASGRKFVLFDVDAPLEDSLAGVLDREPGGADPLPPFKIVSDGFDAVRLHRAGVIEAFSDPSFGTYHLYATRPDGQRIEVATIDNGQVTTQDPDLFAQVIEPAATSLAEVRITTEMIDAMTASLPAERAAQIRGILEKYLGWTWKAALDAHSMEKPK
jgi:hypothetical protein